MNYLQLVNAVLRRLRESEVTTVQGTGNNNSYARLIGDYVNEAKAQVEDAWQWLALKQTLTVTTVSGTSEYILTGSKHRFQPTLVYNDTKDWEMSMKERNWIIEQLNFGATASGSPAYYSFSGVDSTNDSMKVQLYPIPDAVESIKFYGVVRPTSLSADSDVLIVPDRPVILLATAMATEERGEDGGQPSINAYRLAQNALADEIALDAARQPEYTVWYQT